MIHRKTAIRLAAICLLTFPLIGAVSTSLLPRSGHAGFAGVSTSKIRFPSDDELGRIVGFCDRCCLLLGTCVGWGNQPCDELPSGQCVAPGSDCSACNPAVSTYMCSVWTASPGDVCSTFVTPCNTFQPRRACSFIVVQGHAWCGCLQTAGTQACGVATHCVEGSANCP